MWIMPYCSNLISLLSYSIFVSWYFYSSIGIEVVHVPYLGTCCSKEWLIYFTTLLVLIFAHLYFMDEFLWFMGEWTIWDKVALVLCIRMWMDCVL